MFIRQLNYLVALSQEQHFGRAAAVCNVSQPALSGAIRSIEQELGVIIVQRGQRFQGFTKDGERVLAWARRVLADCEGLRQDAHAGEGDPAGTLRIGAIPASLPLFPMLMQGCLQRYPRLRYQLHTLCAAETLRKLANFELDLGVSYLDDEHLRAFETLPVFRERYVIIASDPTVFEGMTSMPWADAANLPLCLFTENLQCRQGINAAFAAAAGDEPSPIVEADSMTALCAHVHRAGLYSILPHSVLCFDDVPSRLYALPMTPSFQRDVGLVLLKQDPRSPVLDAAMRSFCDLNFQREADKLLERQLSRPGRTVAEFDVHQTGQRPAASPSQTG